MFPIPEIHWSSNTIGHTQWYLVLIKVYRVLLKICCGILAPEQATRFIGLLIGLIQRKRIADSSSSTGMPDCYLLVLVIVVGHHLEINRIVKVVTVAAKVPLGKQFPLIVNECKTL